jgi:hypothetical protein
LLSYLSSVNVAGEVERRRNLYLCLDDLLKKLPCEPVVKELTHNIVPYGYPFYASYEEIGEIKKYLEKYSIYCFQWPELPSTALPSTPQYYKAIWVVSFLC